MTRNAKKDNTSSIVVELDDKEKTIVKKGTNKGKVNKNKKENNEIKMDISCLNVIPEKKKRTYNRKPKTIVKPSEVVEFNEIELEIVVEPEVVEPEVVEPEVVEPEIIEPEVVEPEVVEPEIIEPEVVEPEVVEPEIIEPEVVEPEVVEPEIIENVFESEDSELSDIEDDEPLMIDIEYRAEDEAKYLIDNNTSKYDDNDDEENEEEDEDNVFNYEDINDENIENDDDNVDIDNYLKEEIYRSFDIANTGKTIGIAGSINPSNRCERPATEGMINKLINEIKIFLNNNKLLYDYIIITQEIGKNGRYKKASWHYHFGIRFKTHQRYERLLNKMKIMIDDLFKVSKDKEKEYTTCLHPVNNLDGWNGYLYKDRLTFEPIIVPSDLKNNEKFMTKINKCSEIYNNNRMKKDVRVNKYKNNMKWIDEVRKMMNDKGYRVNKATRDIINIKRTNEENIEMMRMRKTERRMFFEELGLLRLNERYGSNKSEGDIYSIIDKYISKPIYNMLPDIEPDRRYIIFLDGYYTIESGIFTEYSKKKEERDKQPKDGLYKVTKRFCDHMKIPKRWVALIAKQKWDLEKFITAYSYLYKERTSINDSCQMQEKVNSALYIVGDSNSGKSTLMSPIKELYKNTLVLARPDGRFTFSNFANCDVVGFEELKFHELKEDVLDSYKQFLDGENLTVYPSKGKMGVRIGPKQVYILANDSISEMRKRCLKNKDYMALMNRCNLWETSYVIGNNEMCSDSIYKISLEAIEVCILCTQRENYIPFEYVEEYYEKYLNGEVDPYEEDRIDLRQKVRMIRNLPVPKIGVKFVKDF
jgi:hypothetical protein